MASISRSDDPILDDILRHRPQVVSEAYPGKEINDQSGEIHGIDAELSRLVVPRKDVMVVVPSFTKCSNSNQLILCWVYVPISF